MNLKEHIKTTYNIKDVFRKILNFFLDCLYKFPLVSYFYNKKLYELEEKFGGFKKLYIVKVTEGLGNQMFQYAFAKVMSKKAKTILNIQSKRRLYRKKYMLSKFNIDLEQTDFELEGKFNIEIIKEKTPFKFDEKLISSLPPSYFKGYFQSYKYLDEVRCELIKEFQPKVEFTEEYLNMADEILNSNSVLLNFRIGCDYKKLGWALDMSYQRRAVNYMKNLIGEDAKFFIFADDIKTVYKQFYKEDDFVFVDLGKNNKDKPFLDLELMKKCRHDIITNSTFSFWAAYLNENPNKKVIAPNPWIFEDDELIPLDWIRLDVV